MQLVCYKVKEKKTIYQSDNFKVSLCIYCMKHSPNAQNIRLYLCGYFKNLFNLLGFPLYVQYLLYIFFNNKLLNVYEFTSDICTNCQNIKT